MLYLYDGCINGSLSDLSIEELTGIMEFHVLKFYEIMDSKRDTKYYSFDRMLTWLKIA